MTVDMDQPAGLESHFTSYAGRILEDEGQSGTDHVASLRHVADEFLERKVAHFDNCHSERSLLLGEVQSGKTSQIFGILAATADANPLFKTFVLLTTSNISLHTQTLERAMGMLRTFDVCGEFDDLRFAANRGDRPLLVILKKNVHVLKRWRNTLANASSRRGGPIMIIDDEADATGLNTKVNQGEVSAINGHLDAMRTSFASSLYLQVTATPQALFLQTSASGWKPEDCIYFPPGKGYLGGQFFFSDPPPYSYKKTPENDLERICTGFSTWTELPDGFLRATAAYMVASAHHLKMGGVKTSYLIHPSWTQDVHATLRRAAELALAGLGTWNSDHRAQGYLEDAWNDLQSSKPDLLSCAELMDEIPGLTHNIQTLNSSAEATSVVSFEPGSNVVIGGNSLGRGITFPMLLTTYYCRRSRMPQMDTIWQHCRMFGYDRDPGLSRMFVPGALYDLFSEAFSSNQILVDLVKDGRIEDIQVVSVPSLRPTRRAVIDMSSYVQIVGGTNYYPGHPDQTRWSAQLLDEVVARLGEGETDVTLSVGEFVKVLHLFESPDSGEWSAGEFIRAAEAWDGHRKTDGSCRVMVRRDRDVSSGTGTLLSPSDRTLAGSISGSPVLVLYRLNGSTLNGWEGHAFWIPNIKLPDDFVFNFVN